MRPPKNERSRIAISEKKRTNGYRGTATSRCNENMWRGMWVQKSGFQAGEVEFGTTFDVELHCALYLFGIHCLVGL